MIALGPLVLLFFAQGYTAPGQGTPACEVSTDPTYGYTKENPIQIGGGALFVKAREQRYLNALRGPEGQALSYKRRGAVEAPKWDDRTTFLDEYEITWTGATKPLILYLDAYRFWEHRAPSGLSCAEPFNLQPSTDAFLASDTLLALALEKRDTPLTPIPLDADGNVVHGVMWDGFRLLALNLQGTALPPGRPKPQPPGTVVFAYPRACEGRTIAPIDVEIISGQGSPVQRTGVVVSGAGTDTLVPGFTPPAGSIASRFTIQQVRPTDRIRITYADACAESKDTTLPVKFSPPKSGESPQPALPDGGKPGETRVLLQVMVDLHGRLKYAHYAGGPAFLYKPALEAVKSWRAEPARVNGAPVPAAMLVLVPFK